MAATYGHDPSTVTFTPEQYRRMVDADILTEDDKVELLENYIVQNFPRGPLHDGTLQGCTGFLIDLVPEGWHLRTRTAVVFSDSEPEPDLSIARGEIRDYMRSHPTAADCGLIIEAANASLTRDRIDKARIYARGNIPIYWLLNLVESHVEVFMHPSGPTAAPSYRSARVYSPGESLPLILGESPVTEIPVSNLIRPRSPS